MIAYKRTVTVEDPDRVVISGLPFRKGQKVEVVVLAAEELQERRPRKGLRALLKATQRASALRPVTERQIAEEIVALRSGR
jgi:hypothetical protein